MGSHHPPIRSLILLGGQSSRMGSPKYLLPIPSEISEAGEEAPLLIHSLYLHHIFQVKYGDPLIRTVTLSVRDEAQRDEIKDLIEKHEDDLPVDLKISYVQDSQEAAGPAAGLTAAWRLDNNAHWIVTGCDYPRISKAALEELRKHHQQAQKAITCFVNSEEITEPLLAIWSNTALERLNCVMKENSKVGPNFIIKLLEEEEEDERSTPNTSYTKGVFRIKPSFEHWLTSVNTRDDWNKVVETIRKKYLQSDP